MSAWHANGFRGFDTETTGINPASDRVVTAAIVDAPTDRRPRAIEWIIDPGIDIPAEAAAVHGWTNDRVLDAVGGPDRAVRIEGGQQIRMSAEGALFEIALLVAQSMARDIPIVAANASYDLTLLEHELDRYGIDRLATRPTGITGVVDPMVIDKQWDPYRKSCYKAPGCNVEEKHHECGGCRGGQYRCGGCGSTDKTLTSLAKHYRVPLTAAHSAAADALAAVRVAARLGSDAGWGAINRYKLETLHRNQIDWKRQQADSLRSFWKKKGDERWREVDGGWPLQDQVVAKVAA